MKARFGRRARSRCRGLASEVVTGWGVLWGRIAHLAYRVHRTGTPCPRLQREGVGAGGVPSCQLDTMQLMRRLSHPRERCAVQPVGKSSAPLELQCGLKGAGELADAMR